VRVRRSAILAADLLSRTVSRRAATRDRKDIAIINHATERLNREAADTLRYPRLRGNRLLSVAALYHRLEPVLPVAADDHISRQRGVGDSVHDDAIPEIAGADHPPVENNAGEQADIPE
jgi:hypothetical protein